MKKLFFLPVLFLLFSFNTNSDLKVETNVKTKSFTIIESENSAYKTVITRVITDDFFCTEHHGVYYRGKLVATFTTEESGDGCGFTGHWIQ